MKKKILAIFEEFSTSGGAEVSTNILLDYLSDDFEIKKAIIRSSWMNLLPVNASLFFKNLFWKKKVEKLIAKNNPDLIMTRHHLTLICNNAKNKPKKRVFSVMRDWWFLTPDREEFERYSYSKEKSIAKKIIGIFDYVFCCWSRKQISKSLKEAKIFAVSDFMCKKLGKEFGIEAQVLYPPIEKQFFEVIPDDEKKFGERKILMVGRMTEDKGFHIVIEAMKNIDAKLEIISNSKNSYYYFCKRMSEREGISGKVFFAGRIKHNEIIDFYKQASVAVIPSIWHEPFGRICGEAMATSTPIIVSDRGGLSENARHQLIAALTPSSFAQKINQLLGDFSLYKKMSAAAKKDSLEFSIEIVGELLKKEIKKELGE